VTEIHTGIGTGVDAPEVRNHYDAVCG